MGVSTHILLARRERERREREATRRAEAGEAVESQGKAEPEDDANALAEEAFAFEGEPPDGAPDVELPDPGDSPNEVGYSEPGDED